MDNGISRERRDGPSIEVLHVEDNPGDTRLVEEAFNELDIETTLQAVSDGAEAVEVLSRRAAASAPLPDLVLLDLNLPRMDGFEVLDAIRDDSFLSHLPVLILTSSDAEDDRIESYDRLANAYLTKPVAPDDYVSLVKAIKTFWGEYAELPPASAY